MRHAIAVAGLLAVVAGRGNGQELFARTDYFFGSTHPIRVVAADVDGDGFQDLLVAGTTGSAGKVHVLINSGSGTFTRKPKLTTTGAAFSIAAADFDLDGDPDLAVGTGYPNYGVEIFENRAGTYVLVNSLSAPNGEVNALVALDLDGDAVPDLAVAEAGDIIRCVGALVRVRTNVGGFQFNETGTYSTQCQPFDMTAGDFDGANGVDLATADRRSSGISVFWNDGSGDYSNSTTVPLTAGNAVNYLHAADFDADGLDDIATVEDNGLRQTPIEILWSNGTSFTLQPYAFARESGPIRSGDLDGDGDLDLVEAADDSPAFDCWFTVLRNQGNRTFSEGISQLSGVSPRGLVVADLDPSNPLPDVAVGGFGSTSISVFLQTRTTWPVLELSASALVLYLGDQLTLTASNGAPGGQLLAATMTINGIPSFQPVALATFDSAGRWQLGATIGPGLYGLQLELAVFGYDASGRLSTSNWTELEFH